MHAFLESPYYGLRPTYPCFSYATGLQRRLTGQGLHMLTNGNLRNNKGQVRCQVVLAGTTPDVSADSEGRAMDEPVRWVSKAEAAQELEISLSTLDRMIRKGDLEVVREGRRGLCADARAGVPERQRSAAPGHHERR